MLLVRNTLIASQDQRNASGMTSAIKMILHNEKFCRSHGRTVKDRNCNILRDKIDNMTITAPCATVHPQELIWFLSVRGGVVFTG